LSSSPVSQALELPGEVAVPAESSSAAQFPFNSPSTLSGPLIDKALALIIFVFSSPQQSPIQAGLNYAGPRRN
jgi:hypothetical protein